MKRHSNAALYLSWTQFLSYVKQFYTCTILAIKIGSGPRGERVVYSKTCSVVSGSQPDAGKFHCVIWPLRSFACAVGNKPNSWNHCCKTEAVFYMSRTFATKVAGQSDWTPTFVSMLGPLEFLRTETGLTYVQMQARHVGLNFKLKCLDRRSSPRIGSHLHSKVCADAGPSNWAPTFNSNNWSGAAPWTFESDWSAILQTNRGPT